MLVCVLKQNHYHCSGKKQERKFSALEKQCTWLRSANFKRAPGYLEGDNVIWRGAVDKISPPHVVQTLHMKVIPHSWDIRHVLCINTARCQKLTFPGSTCRSLRLLNRRVFIRTKIGRIHIVSGAITATGVKKKSAAKWPKSLKPLSAFAGRAVKQDAIFAQITATLGSNFTRNAVYPCEM